jgi:hypothetical protein
MPKTGPKPKAIADRRYNPLGYRIRTQLPAETIFDQAATNLLQRARGEDPDEVQYSDSDDWKDGDASRRRSWTQEQKLAAIKYATTTIITDEKSGIKKLIPRHAAAKNIKCTAKMLREWIKDQDAIYASPVGTRKRRVEVLPKEPEMEQRLHKLFLQKREIERRIGSMWIHCNARRIYADIHPDRVVWTEGKPVQYKEFAFSRGWFAAFLKRKNISLRVSLLFFLFFIKFNKLYRHQQRKPRLYQRTSVRSVRIGCNSTGECSLGKGSNYLRLRI